jgi:hypothetical protein
MGWIKTGFKVCLLAVILCIPPMGVIFLFFGIKAAAFSGLVPLAWIFYLALTCEKKVIRFYRASESISRGLKRTVDWVANDSHLRIVIYSDPHPSIKVLKSLGGRGTLLISQGLVAQFDESDLRNQIQLSLKQIRQPGITFKSLCALLELRIRKRMPIWGDSPTPCSAVLFLLLYPYATVLRDLSNF